MRNRKIKKTDLAWLAGLVDGEGSIGFYSHKEVLKRKYHVVRYRPTLHIANTDCLIINEAEHIVQSILSLKPLPKITYKMQNKPRYHVCFMIRVQDKSNVLKVLEAIEPYLIGKKAQAQLLINMLKHHVKRARYTRAELEVIDILKAMKFDNMKPLPGNTELAEGDKPLRASVEHIQVPLPLDEG
jgi:hypothetical protein